MPSKRTRTLVYLATVFGGLLAGGAMDRVVVQDPAWRHFETAMRARYIREADLGRGVAWYPVEGLSALLFSCAAALSMSRENPEVRVDAAGPATTAAALSIIALILTAGAIVPGTRAVARVTDETFVRGTFDHLAIWWTGKAALHTATFLGNVLTLARLHRN